MRFNIVGIFYFAFGLLYLIISIINPEKIIRKNRFDEFEVLKPNSYYNLQFKIKILNSVILIFSGIIVVYLDIDSLILSWIPLILYKLLNFICRYVSIEKGYARIIT